MEPARIKLYGLVSMTRRAYLVQLVIAAALLVVLFALWAYLPPPHPASPEHPLPFLAEAAVWLVRRLPWFLLGLAGLYVIEAVIVLRRFARQEALQKDRKSRIKGSDPLF